MDNFGQLIAYCLLALGVIGVILAQLFLAPRWPDLERHYPILKAKWRWLLGICVLFAITGAFISATGAQSFVTAINPIVGVVWFQAINLLTWLSDNTWIPRGLAVALVIGLLIFAATVIVILRSTKLMTNEIQTKRRYIQRLEAQVQEGTRLQTGLVDDKSHLNEQLMTVKTSLALLIQTILQTSDQRLSASDALKNSPLSFEAKALGILHSWTSNAIQRVVYYDPAYPKSFISNQEQVKDYFVQKGFTQKKAAELRIFMQESIRNGSCHRSMVVFAQDVLPDTVVESFHPSCTLRRFLNEGGRVVWRGDIPAYYVGRDGFVLHEEGPIGPYQVLRIMYTNFFVDSPYAKAGYLWDSDFPIEVTPAGRDIGLALVKPVRRPVAEQYVDTDYARTTNIIPVRPNPSDPPSHSDYFSCCWKKIYNAKYPHGGFLQYYLGEWDGANETELDQYLKFANSSWPLNYFNPT